MASFDSVQAKRIAFEPRGKYFTVARANASLVLVRKIVTDIVREYRIVKDLEEEFVSLDHQNQRHERERIRMQCQTKLKQLESFNAELTEIGVELKDWQNGLVDFPARHDDRDVFLCWKLGEDAVAYWHELDTGFAGRQDIKENF